MVNPPLLKFGDLKADLMQSGYRSIERLEFSRTLGPRID